MSSPTDASYDAVAIAGEAVYWVEGRAERDTLVRWTPAVAGQDVLPPGSSVGSLVHEYGGGAYLATPNGLWFCRADDQRIYRAGTDRAHPITPASGDGAHRYADLRLTRNGLLVCVRERHEPTGVINELVALPADGSSTPRVIAEGWEFYSYPRPSPDGRQLAWTSWNSPLMPWDGSWLWIAELHRDGQLGTPRHVAGGPDESIFQPEWSPDGELYFVSDRTEWWNLYAHHRSGQTAPVLQVQAEIGVAQWEFGYATYAFLHHNRIAVLLQEGSRQRLAVLDEPSGRLDPITLPYSSIKPYLATDGRHVTLIGSSHQQPPTVALIDSTTGAVRELTTTRSGSPATTPTPEKITFPTRDGSTAYGLLHPTATAQPPPLIVRPHPGPTSNTTERPDAYMAFFTSRGFALLDVDYHGSTGYGRHYRNALRGQWGQLDVTDCADAVQHLAATGRIDPTRAVISGASAGGYTALRALATTDVFAAGVARSAVIDPLAWRDAAPKFQTHHTDLLIGPWPQAQATYHQRSVLHHADAITRPVLLIHGEDDTVTPITHAQALAEALGTCASLVPLAHEGHMLRQAANITRALHAELAHYQRALSLGSMPE